MSVRVVSGRSCGTCTLCCKAVGVLEIDKPAGVVPILRERKALHNL